MDLILNFDLSNRAGLCFGHEQGPDGCWFGWLYLGTSIGGSPNWAEFPSWGVWAVSGTFQCHSGNIFKPGFIHCPQQLFLKHYRLSVLPSCARVLPALDKVVLGICFPKTWSSSRCNTLGQKALDGNHVSSSPVP